MRTVVRWFVVVVVVGHGLIHLLGAAKGLGWAEVSELTEPISPAMGIAWLTAAVFVVAAGVLLAVAAQWWWVVGAVSVLVSQAVIMTSWSDAKAGTLANAVLLAAVGYTLASRGPASYRADYRRRAGAAHDVPLTGPVVTETDPAHLSRPIAASVRQPGPIGQPRVDSSGVPRWSDGHAWDTANRGSEQERTWAMLSHLSFFVPLLVPAIVLRVTVGRRDPFTRHHTTEALNAQIWFLMIWSVLLLPWILIGIEGGDPPAWAFIGLALGFVASLSTAGLAVLGSVQAGKGIWWRYPVPFRVVPGSVRTSDRPAWS